MSKHIKRISLRGSSRRKTVALPIQANRDPAIGRAAILRKLRGKVAAGQPIIGAGAGTGISAKCEEAGGVDLIVIYNSGRFRMAGRGSLAGLMPYGNANQIVTEMAGEVLTAVRHTPVLAGVCATDPFLLRDRFLRELRDLGFAGIQNFPTVGLIDGQFRANLEETGMSYQLEVECIRAARDLELLTTPYVFNVAEARAMAEAGADIIVAHMGLTTSGTIGARTAKTLEDCVGEVQAIVDASPCVRMCSRFVTAAQSLRRRTRNSSSNATGAWTDFTARARWNGFRLRQPSPPGCGSSRRCIWEKRTEF